MLFDGKSADAWNGGKVTPEGFLPGGVKSKQEFGDCTLHLEFAIRNIRDLRHIEDVQSHLKEIGRLENEADTIYRDSDSALFADPPDILMLIKWRELYGWLEETVDACKDTANVISEIVIKGT